MPSAFCGVVGEIQNVWFKYAWRLKEIIPMTPMHFHRDPLLAQAGEGSFSIRRHQGLHFSTHNIEADIYPVAAVPICTLLQDFYEL